MKIHRSLGLCAVTLGLALLPGHAQAQSIGVNFSGPNIFDSQFTDLAPTDSAGVLAFAQTNWQNVSSTPTNLTLSNSAGAATSARLTVTSSSGRGSVVSVSQYTPAGPDETLNAGYFVGSGAGASLTLNLTNIPYTAYSLIVYDLSSKAGDVQSVTLNAAAAASFFISTPDFNGNGYVDGNAATPYTYTQGTGLTAATATANADYVLFTGLTGSSLNFTVADATTDMTARLGGFQIINTVPEPSTWVLLGLGVGAIGLALRQRRRPANAAARA